jgi:hypothetical protein
VRLTRASLFWWLKFCFPCHAALDIRFHSAWEAALWSNQRCSGVAGNAGIQYSARPGARHEDSTAA